MHKGSLIGKGQKEGLALLYNDAVFNSTNIDYIPF